MTQQQLDRLVAKATGEDIRNIKRRGFSIIDPQTICFDPDPDQRSPQWVDWDALEHQRAQQADAQR